MNRKLKYYYSHQDTINETKRKTRNIENVIRLKELLKTRSLNDKIAKDTTQFDLKETFKPLLEGQTSQTKEIVKTQKKSSDAQLQQQREIETIKSQEGQEKHKQLINEIRKQPTMIPLIKSLNMNPKIIDVINGKSDGSDLTGREQHILKQIDEVDDRVLRTLIDFYASPRYEDTTSELESWVGTASATESSIPGTEAASEEARIMFNSILSMKHDKPTDRHETKIKLKDLFDNEENRNRFMLYLDTIDYSENLSIYPYSIIKSVNPEFYKEIKEAKKGKGISVKFLTSDPNELLNKLQILMAEKQAGNNNVFNEISAIVDELVRLGYLTKERVKKIYKMIA